MIKNLEITEEMYKRANEVEKAWLILKDAERTLIDTKKELKKLTSEWIKLDNAFQNEVNSEFDTREIVLEYERRKRG